MVTPNTYELLNAAWKSTLKIIFHDDLGELRDFEPYLKEALIGTMHSSFISKKPVWTISEKYDKKAKFLDYETEYSDFQKIISKPLSIDKIKDIDSLLEVLNERLIYSGNTALGNSKNVEHSDAVVNSTNVLNSSIVVQSRNIAFSYLKRENEYSFGSASSGQSSYIIRCFYNNSLKRCFECSTSVGLSDCYFCYNLMGCTDCMFSFNLRSKRYAVGNVELEQSKYLELKNKLVTEIKDELKTKKRFKFSIIDLLNA